MTQKLNEELLAELKDKSVADVKEFGEQARQEYRALLDKIETKDGGYDTTSEEYRELKVLDARMEAANVTNQRRQEREALEARADMVIAGGEELKEAIRRGDQPIDSLFDYFRKQGVPEDCLPKPMDAVTQEKKSFHMENVSMRDIFNVVTEAGGVGNTPTGVTASSPRSLDAIVQATDFRPGLLPFMATMDIGVGNTYSFLKEVDSGYYGATNPVAGRSENTALPTTDPGAITQSVSVVKRGVMSTVSSEQLEDVPQYRPFWEASMFRAVLEDSEHQLIHGTGGNAAPVANDMVGLVGTLGSGAKRTANIRFKERSNVANTDANLFKWLSDSIAAFEAKRTSSGYGRTPTHLVITPAQYRDIMSTMDTTNRPIAGDVLTGARDVLWGIRLVVSDYLDAGITAASDYGVAILLNIGRDNFELVSKRGVTMEFGLNADDFAKNVSSARVTHRVNLALKKPRAVMLLQNFSKTKAA